MAQATAQSVVVIPLLGDDAEPPSNIISVAQENGDFDNPITAVNSIPASGPDAPSATNPYVIVIAPGNYVLTSRLVMRPFVSVVGSGKQATILSGSISGENSDLNAALIEGASNTELSNLRVENQLTSPGNVAIGVIAQGIVTFLIKHIEVSVNGATRENIGIKNSFVGPVIHDVKITVNGAGNPSSINTALENNSSPVTLGDINLTAVGGATTIGMNNPFSAVRMRNATINASGGTTANSGIINSGGPFFVQLRDFWITASGGTTNIGIDNDDAAPKISNGYIWVLGGTSSYGVRSTNSAAPILTSVDIEVEGSTTTYGVLVSSGTTKIRRSSVVAATDTVHAQAGAIVNVTSSMIENGNVGGAGDINCYNATSDAGTGFYLSQLCVPQP
ncbi:MAG: hypothetical protein AAF431_09990 [Pseudomonadota bacterium]